jgi:hypothetical protein
MALDPELRGLSSDDEGGVDAGTVAPRPLMHLPVVIPLQADLVDLPPRWVQILSAQTLSNSVQYAGRHTRWSLCKQLVVCMPSWASPSVSAAVAGVDGRWAGRVSKTAELPCVLCCSTGADDDAPAEQPADEALPDQSMQHAVPAAELAAS